MRESARHRREDTPTPANRTSFRNHDPSGSRADVRQVAVWENGEWFTEIKRALNTGDADGNDVTFEGTKDYQFGIALMDNAGGSAHYTTAGLVVTMTMPVITSVEDYADNSSIPKTFALNQNYPNPFNPATTVSYQLPKNENVVLDIYNITGQLIKSLVNEPKNAGNYRIQWNGTNESGQRVATGIYIYHLKAGSYEKTRKMVLLK